MRAEVMLPDTPADLKPKALRGALRILSRDDDRQVLIVHGHDRRAGPGERLAFVDWFPTTDVAEEISRYCSELLIAASAPPDEDGWHDFDVANLDKLVRVAIDHQINRIAIAPAKTARQAWTGERIARLGYLVGQGCMAKAIAVDPLIRSNPNNVYRQAGRFKLSLSDTPHGRVGCMVPIATTIALDRLAAGFGKNREGFLRLVLISLGRDPERWKSLLETTP